MGHSKKKFDSDWWRIFLKKNQSFSKTTVFRNVITDEQIKALNEGVCEMLKSRINRNEINNGFRLYIGEEEQSDFQISKLIKGKKFCGKNFEDLQFYCKKNFGDKIGIITNYSEKHSEILANRILKTIQPLLDIAGIPPWGLELTTFIGNYGWTPLGIHKDERGENVLHYHLGPGKKQMYVWDEKTYLEKGSGISNNKNIEPLLKYAKKFLFGPGDLYYMPWNVHHVGYTDEFSIGVTLWFNNPTKYNFSKLMIDTIKNIYLKNNQEIIENQLNYINNEDTFNDFISTLDIKSKILKEPLETFLYKSYNEYKKCLMSNGGWQNPPLRFFEKIDSKKDYFLNLESKTIITSSLFEMRTEKIDNRLYVYVRGYRISFKYYSELEKIVSKLNQENIEIEVSSIISEFQKLPKEVVLYFLKTLINNKGITIKEIEFSD